MIDAPGASFERVGPRLVVPLDPLITDPHTGDPLMSIPIDLDEFKRAITAAKGIEVRAGDQTFTIMPPELMSDEDYATLKGTDDDDIVAQARIMMPRYDEFVAAGGSAMIVAQIVQQQAERQQAEQGVSPGEPGASLTS